MNKQKDKIEYLDIYDNYNDADGSFVRHLQTGRLKQDVYEYIKYKTNLSLKPATLDEMASKFKTCEVEKICNELVSAGKIKRVGGYLAYAFISV